jgi:HPt (histidine-containing phosphotransfer) domain-containing protein
MTVPAVDRAVLEGLAQSFGGGDEGWEFVRELIDTFLDDAPGQLAKLRAALETGDAEGARRAAHTLKSNGATFGAQAFTELCRELEALSKDGTLDGAPALLGQIEKEWSRTRDELVALRESGVG